MRIAYIARSVIPSREANSIQVMKMCQAFADLGHEVLLVIPNKASGDNDFHDVYNYYGIKNRFPIKRFPYQGHQFKFIMQVFGIRKALEEFKPDIVYGRCMLGCAISCFLGYDSAYESHKPFWRGHVLKRLFFSLLVRHKSFKGLVVISEALKRMYIDADIIHAEKLQVAHDGADSVSDNVSIIELKGQKGLLNVGYSGHLYRGKGMEVIAAIAPMLPDVNFHIVGGKENDLLYWRSVITAPNVYFYGFINQSDISRYIQSFDICLLPNQKIVLPSGTGKVTRNISDYTSPLKMFEYMSHQKPIISSDLPVLREVLNEKNSVLVKSDDFSAWIKAIKDLKDEQYRLIIAAQAYKDFMMSYTWVKRAKNILSGIVD